MTRLSRFSLGALVAVGLVAAASSVAGAHTKSSTPVVTSLSPNNGPTDGGTSVTIKGQNLVNATHVFFGSASANFTFKNAHVIVATSPSSSSTGPVDVTVETPNGTSEMGSSADQFTYVEDLPTIQNIAPKQGPPVGGNKVTIVGQNLEGATSVTFGGAPATILTDANGETIQVTAPSGTLGDKVNVQVTTGEGPSPLSSADLYTYVQNVPVVQSITLDTGPSSGGTQVEIKGRGFSKKTTSAVDFGGVAAESYTVMNNTTIDATSPRGSGTVEVTVTTSKGTSNATGDEPGDEFFYTGGGS
jgi:hypothetical protein